MAIAPKGQPRQVLQLVAQDDHFQAAVDLIGLPALQVTAELKNGPTAVRTTFQWTILDATDRIEDGEPLEGLKI